jgi:DNA invertase Pin-like site-specific DNA recombinase
MDLNNIVNQLTNVWKQVVFIENQLDTGSIHWTLMLNIFWSFAQFESGMISERVRRWMKEAKDKWAKFWRPRSKSTLEKEEIRQIRLMRQRKLMTYSAIAKELWYSSWSVIRNKLLRYKTSNTHKEDTKKRVVKFKKTRDLNIANGIIRKPYLRSKNKKSIKLDNLKNNKKGKKI